MAKIISLEEFKKQHKDLSPKDAKEVYKQGLAEGLSLKIQRAQQTEENKAKTAKENLKKLKTSTYTKSEITKYRRKLAKQIGERKAQPLILQQQLQRAPIRASAQQLAFAQQQASQRQRKMGILSGRAEALECEFCNFDEVPLLKNMESQRMKMTSPPNKSLARIEKEVTDSFPD